MNPSSFRSANALWQNESPRMLVTSADFFSDAGAMMYQIDGTAAKGAMRRLGVVIERENCSMDFELASE